MLVKHRKEPKELLVLSCLNKRFRLSEKEQKYYSNLEKGFDGEKKFDLLLENLPDEWVILNDLHYEVNNTEFQIDTLLISQKSIYLFEVKNYEGDFYVDGDNWGTMSGSEIKNPIFQLKRCQTLLRALLKELGLNFRVEATLIFINPEFTLYQAPVNQPIIFPTQLKRFLKDLNRKSPKVNDLRAAEQLLSGLSKESYFKRAFNYDFEQLQKGINCFSCNSLSTAMSKKKIVCNRCGCIEDVESALLRNVEQIKLLFPERKITINTIHEWCKVIESKKNNW